MSNVLLNKPGSLLIIYLYESKLLPSGGSMVISNGKIMGPSYSSET